MVRRWLRAILGALALGLTALPAAETPALDLTGVRVLVCAGYMDLYNIPALQRLRTAGAEVRKGAVGELTEAGLTPYHLVIGIDWPQPRTVGAGGAPGAAALDAFIKRGGGLLAYRHYFGSEGITEYLKPFAADIPLELVQDPSHAFTAPTGFRLPYAYTDRVTADHPLTTGVKGVWYNAQRAFLFHTSPVQVTADWQVLVTGMPEASSLWVGGLNEEHLSRPGRCASAPPLVAAREYGAGGIVLFGFSPMEVFYGQGLAAYQDTAMARGDGVRPSDLGRLYTNALSWLASRARAAKDLGQGALPAYENDWAKPTIPDWTKLDLSADLCTAPARGVIGLHSTLSDGKATPAALITKARAAGLQWVAFTERLEAFSAEKWNELRALCKATSSAEFAALPGLDYQDHAGARYVAFGDFDWPPDKVFSPDRQRIVEPQWWFNIGCRPNGPYDLAHSPLRYWDFSLYNFLPIRTTLAGQQVEDERTTLPAFRHMQGVMDDPFPMAVDMVYDEDGLAAAAGRMCNFITRDRPDDLTKFYTDLGYYGSYRGFVSDGPLVTDWRAVNDSRVTGGVWWLPGTEQYRVKLAARSAVPLAEVAIYDGPRLFRRFRPNQPQATLVFDLPHDQQRNLVAQVTDANGKQAITGGLFVRDWLNWRFMCSDRGNSICDGVQVDEGGAYLTGPTAPYQRKMTAFGVCVGYGERHFNILPPDFDGGMRPTGLHITPWFSSPGFTYRPPDSTIEARMEVPVCSRDGLLQDDSLVGYFAGPADSWSRKTTPRDLAGVRIRYRYLDLVKRAHDPGVILVEGTLTFDRPLKIDSLTVFSVFHSCQPGEGDHYALSTPETTVAGMSAGTPYSASGSAVPGSYACVFPSPWGSAGFVALDPGYTLTVAGRTGNTHLNAALSPMPRELKQGDEVRYRFLLLRGRLGEPPNTAEWERFVQVMGIRGQPGYTVDKVKAGRIQGTSFLLELVPDGGGVAATVSAADLPVRLPVRVEGLNPNWTFAWFDLDRKEWYPSAVDGLTRIGFFSLDTRRGAHRFFAGHPVVADDPEVRIAVFSDAKSEVRASLNNAGDGALSLDVRLNPALGAAPAQAVTLAPGELRTLTFAFQP